VWNSGRSSEPHLHFHAQSVTVIGNPKGLKCWFGEKSKSEREIQHDYFIVRGDVVGECGFSRALRYGRYWQRARPGLVASASNSLSSCCGKVV